MTDREPDDLYDALRDRLADFGQEPPAPLWAGIRSQLPPPVAQPQLRRRKRRMALLSLLLLIVSVGSWQLWRTAGPGRNAQHQEQAATALTHPATPETAAHTSGPATPKPAPETSSSTENASTASAEPAKNQTVAATTASTPQQRNANRESHLATTMATTALPSPVASPAETKRPDLAKSAVIAGGNEAARIGAGTRSTTRKALALVAAAAARPAANTASQARRQQRQRAMVRAARAALPRSESAALAMHQRKAASAWGTALETGTGQRAKSAPAARTATAAAVAGAVANTLSTDARQVGNLTPPTGTDGTASPTPATGTAASAVAGFAESNASTDGYGSFADNRLAVDGLPLRFIGLETSQALRPAPLSPLALPDWQAPAVRPHWSVQVLLGPSLTFRRLAAPQDVPEPVATNSPTVGNSLKALDQNSANVASVERPALAPSGQIQFRRSLNGRWALAGGLGYRQYVSALSVQVYQATTRIIPISASSSYLKTDSALVGTIHRRDTYQYLTVPVQASYALGVGGRRWHTAVLAGAEMGVYVGGTTSEGPPCNCAARTWTPTGSPYRALSLALSLGLDVRYRLGSPGSSSWELLAQPIATYGLTSLARTGSGYYARYPYTAGLLLGLSHDLR